MLAVLAFGLRTIHRAHLDAPPPSPLRNSSPALRDHLLRGAGEGVVVLGDAHRRLERRERLGVDLRPRPAKKPGVAKQSQDRVRDQVRSVYKGASSSAYMYNIAYFRAC